VVTDEAQLEANRVHLLGACTRTFEEIDHYLRNFMTRELQDICGYLYQLVELAFPGNGIPAVGGFIFLRLVCPCIVAPEKYNILSGTSQYTAARESYRIRSDCIELTMQSNSNGV